jgi:hypothetical protein
MVVVLNDHHQGKVVAACKDECLVEGTFLNRTIARDDEGDAPAFPQLHGERASCGDRQVVSEDGRGIPNRLRRCIGLSEFRLNLSNDLLRSTHPGVIRQYLIVITLPMSVRVWALQIDSQI